MLQFLNNLKGHSKKTNTNLSTFITKHKRDLAEHLWLVYIQNDVFTDKNYEQLKHYLGLLLSMVLLDAKIGQ